MPARALPRLERAGLAGSTMGSASLAMLAMRYGGWEFHGSSACSCSALLDMVGEEAAADELKRE